MEKGVVIISISRPEVTVTVQAIFNAGRLRFGVTAWTKENGGRQPSSEWVELFREQIVEVILNSVSICEEHGK